MTVVSAVALDTPPARGLPGTSSALEPSLNLQHSPQTEPRDSLFRSPPRCKTIKIPTFSLPSFLITWPSVNRCIFPSRCPIHPLSFIQQCCHLAFFTSEVTEVAITLQTLHCHYWQNEEGEGAGGEEKRGLFSNNQGKLITPEIIALNASAAMEEGTQGCNMWFSGFWGADPAGWLENQLRKAVCSRKL